MRILAVDDDENIRELLEQSTAATGQHDLVTVASGPEAIRAIAEAREPFDCFLLDIQMPVMNGIELCRRIRKMKGYMRSPIIMLTAMSQKKYIDKAFAAGATDYVTKPFEFLELFSRIDVAEKLVSEQKRSAAVAETAAVLKRDLQSSMQHSLNEPVEILGIERVVGYVSFENYLMQLSRIKLLRSSVFAVKISNITRIFRSVDGLAFRQLLNDVALVLSKMCKGEGSLIAYRGNGVFLIALDSKTKMDQTALEMEMNEKASLSLASRSIDGGARVFAGETVSLMSLTKAGALFSLQKAVGNAERRASDQKEAMAALRRFAMSGRRSDFQNEMERRAYEVLLSDTLKDEQFEEPRRLAARH